MLGILPEGKEVRLDFAYRLAFGTQVREEDFGLLFYTMKGPRLYFLSSGNWLSCQFFESGLGLEEWMKRKTDEIVFRYRLQALKTGLQALKRKGVILGC